ncbi:MAG: hypothetical protein WDW38_008712 [Sanguina aurantia]
MAEASRSSSDEAGDWHMVEADGSPAASPRTMSPRAPTASLTAEQLHSMATALGPLLESELLADHLLGQPFDGPTIAEASGAETSEQSALSNRSSWSQSVEPSFVIDRRQRARLCSRLAPPTSDVTFDRRCPHILSTLSAWMCGASEQQSAQGLHPSSGVDDDDVGGAILERDERALSLQSTARVEDSLDGYTDSERAELFESAPADEEDDGFGGFASLGARVSRVFHGMMREISAELTGLSNSLGSAASVVAMHVMHAKSQAVGAGCSLRQACCQVFKDKGYPPLWLLSLGSLTTLAAAAVITQLYSNNKRLTLQLRQRDRELARLVIKILHLQDALHSVPRAAVPVLRHNVQQLLLS